MKKIVFLSVLFVCTGLFAPSVRAQATYDTIDMPFGMFESWDSYPADSLSIMGGMIKIPVNYDYELPTGWSVPRYRLSENLEYSGMTIPVDVSLPVAVVYPDTIKNVPEGNRALVARTFRFEDVVSPTAYSMAESLLDSTLTSIVLPSIVITGQINLDSVIPLIDRLTVNSTDMSWLLNMMDSVDMNAYLSGGFPLDGFRPGKLLGKYIYKDPGDGWDDDCGAVIMLGTRYDTVEHRRMLVGAGIKTLYELYDSINYEPFEVEYTSLSSYFPESYGYYEADSMVVMVISSCSEKGFQYGSRLYLDQLKMVSQPMPCGRVVNLHSEENAPFYLHIAWNNTSLPDRWEIEYGKSGFRRGFGTTVTVNDSSYIFASLDLNTLYDFYVHGLCGDTAETEWVFLSVLTDSIPSHQAIDPVESERVQLYPNPTQDRCTIDFAGLKANSVRLYDPQGRLVKEMDVKGMERVALTLPSAGVFILEVITDEGKEYKRVFGL